MQLSLRPWLAMAVLAAVVGCKTKTETVQPEPEPQPPPALAEPTAKPLDPRDWTDVRNFDNPQSLLSKRVIYFDFDKSDIRPEFRDTIQAHATYLGAHGTARVTLEGHADERGSREYNLGLGERRGNSVNGALSAQGAARSQLEVVSYGEERPVCRESEESCWWQNRRVEIVYTSR